MPPSREFTFELNEDVARKLEEHLQLKGQVRVKTLRHRSGRLHGDYNVAARLITLQLGVELFTNSRLAAIQTEVLKTLLHEYRHAHQYDTWDPKRIARDKDRPYQLRDIEVDAERFAEEAVSRWKGLGRVRPKGTASRLRRLSAAERGVR